VDDGQCGCVAGRASRSRVHRADVSDHARPLRAALPPTARHDSSRSSAADQRTRLRDAEVRATRVPDHEGSRALLRSRPVSAEPSTCARAAAAPAADRLSTFGAGCPAQIGRSVRRDVKQSAPSGAANPPANPAQQVLALGRCGCPNRLEVGRGPAKLHIRVEATAGSIGVEVEERLAP
jgi:hypothetical protein